MTLQEANGSTNFFDSVFAIGKRVRRTVDFAM